MGVISKQALTAVMGMDELSEGESMQEGEQMAENESWERSSLRSQPQEMVQSLNL